jgi:predicted alpha/beta-fold hydrolase
MANGHLQTYLGIKWPRRYAPYRATQHRVLLDDGDQLVMHEDAAAGSPAEAPIVLLIHGLGGCYQSTYMRRMTEKLTERHYRVFRLDMRGCGAGERLAKLPNHCGRSNDLATALNQIAELYPNANTSIVAFSMSGTIAMNMLAEAGELRVGNLQRTLAICSPIDLAKCEWHFRKGMGRRYDKFFVSLQWQQFVARWKHFPEVAPPEPIPCPPRLRELDDKLLAPMCGFASAEVYYAQASPGPKLASVRQPLTIFTSEDDPVVPVGPLMEANISSAIEVITTPRGGHLGFLAARNDDADFRWLDWRIIDWLEQDIQAKAPTPHFREVAETVQR